MRKVTTEMIRSKNAGKWTWKKEKKYMFFLWKVSQYIRVFSCYCVGSTLYRFWDYNFWFVIEVMIMLFLRTEKKEDEFLLHEDYK